jgi:hypothetical protein
MPRPVFRLSFRDACARYPHRFTMDHVPAWASVERPDGSFYAPQWASDREWYAATTFPGEPGLHGNAKHCASGPCTWPLGQALAVRFAPGQRAA